MAAGVLFEDRLGFLEPARECAVLEAAFGSSMARVVEARHRPGFVGGPFRQRGRFQARHLGLEAWQPNNPRAVPLRTVVEEHCDAAAIGAMANGDESGSR